MTPTILTASGRHFDLSAPEQSPIHISDIAYALANLCRFTGHCKQFYSVAQHSVHVSHLVTAEHAMAALLHDAAEAYLGDVASPLKALLPDYRAIEARVERAVLARFGLRLPLHPSIKHADLVALATEQRDLMDLRGDEWEYMNAIADTTPIRPMPPAVAEAMFLKRYWELTDVRALEVVA